MPFIFAIRYDESEDHGETAPAFVTNVIMASLNSILFAVSTSVAWQRRHKDGLVVRIPYYGGLSLSTGLSALLFIYRAHRRIAGLRRGVLVTKLNTPEAYQVVGSSY